MAAMVTSVKWREIMSEVKESQEAVLAYREWEPDEKISSPKSTRNTFKVRNSSGKSGKYSLKIGTTGSENHTIGGHETVKHDVTGQSVTGVNKGKVNLEWLRD
jgi:hypothetical protein